MQIWEFPKILGVPYFGVLIVRIFGNSRLCSRKPGGNLPVLLHEIRSCGPQHQLNLHSGPIALNGTYLKLLGASYYGFSHIP